MAGVEIRQATIEDSALIHQFVIELATYEKAEHEVLATVSDIENALFGANTTTKALICNFNNEPIGFAVYFSTFQHGSASMGYILKIYMFLLSIEALVLARRF
ncbi:hypothetical protein [Vreelandella boliviensis]|uniref:hypothetical protein n=1 Tax=Vreelandella boliviensis TaxID=223527 RepID=UPI003CC913B8